MYGAAAEESVAAPFSYSIEPQKIEQAIRNYVQLI